MDKRKQYITEHSVFYIYGFRKLIKFAYVLLLVVFCLFAFIIYQNFTRPLPKYFVTTLDGRLIEIQPINP